MPPGRSLGICENGIAKLSWRRSKTSDWALRHFDANGALIRRVEARTPWVVNLATDDRVLIAALDDGTIAATPAPELLRPLGEYEAIFGGSF